MKTAEKARDDRGKILAVGPRRQAVALRSEPDSEAAQPAGLEPSRYRLRLLGLVELEREEPDTGWTTLAWPFRRVIEILALLASSPDARCRRERLIEAIWPESDPSSGAPSLHPTVSHLRKILRDPRLPAWSPVRVRRGVYHLDRFELWDVDLDQLRSLIGNSIEARSLEELEQAAVLYRGPLMEGFSSAWIVEERKKWAALYCRAMERLGRRLSELGRLQDAEDAYRRVLLVDRSNEPVYVEIMRLYSRRGRPDLVRRQFERVCEILLSELQMRPMDTTVREYQRLIGWGS